MKSQAGLLAAIGLVAGSATTAFAAQVTFQVNMSAQIALGNFDPRSHTVYVAGDPINGWSTTESPLTPSAGDSKVFVGTFDVGGTAGATAQYKFLFYNGSGNTWEGN